VILRRSVLEFPSIIFHVRHIGLKYTQVIFHYSNLIQLALRINDDYMVFNLRNKVFRSCHITCIISSYEMRFSCLLFFLTSFQVT
jgi:hypothetical protein